MRLPVTFWLAIGVIAVLVGFALIWNVGGGGTDYVVPSPSPVPSTAFVPLTLTPAP